MKYTETIQKQDGSMVTSQMTILFREATVNNSKDPVKGIVALADLLVKEEEEEEETSQKQQ